jgi:hypothetical protein
MISHIIILYPVIIFHLIVILLLIISHSLVGKNFVHIPQQTEFASYSFTPQELVIFKDLHQILKVLNVEQQLHLSSRIPSLLSALPAFEVLIQTWKCTCTIIPKLAYYIDIGIMKI